jgi:hypothetical protein
MRHVLLVAALVSFAGCFEPDEPLCAFSCGDNGLCPDDYMCLADGYCHLHGDPTACVFPDAAVPVSDGGEDMTMAPADGAPDLTVPPDLLGFTVLNKCPLPSSYTSEPSGLTQTFGNSLGTNYAVPCAQVSLSAGDAGGVVTVSWAPASGGTDTFQTFPLTPSTLGSSGNPIPLSNANNQTPVTVVFATPGFYPYYSGAGGMNDTSGMAGVIWITP